MAVGFLLQKDIVPKWEQVKDIRLDLENGFIYVDTDKAYPFFEQLQNKRYITSCCGMSRQGFIFANDALTAKKMDSNLCLTHTRTNIFLDESNGRTSRYVPTYRRGSHCSFMRT